MDLDGDGHRDILSGSYSRMEQKMAGLFQVLYGNADGTFKKAEVLKGTDNEPLIIPTENEDQMTECICTRPFAVDWDGDGKLDLVVGNFAGTFYWYKGEGKGKFAPKPELIKIDGGGKLKIDGAHSDPFVVDWDGDGDLDIISGSSNGGAYWAENTAGKGKAPALKQFRQLIKPGKEQAEGKVLRENDVTSPSHMTRVWVDDFNGDGKLDILIGDSITLISPAKGVSEAELPQKYKEWEAEFKKVQEEMTALQAKSASKDGEVKDGRSKNGDAKKDDDPKAEKKVLEIQQDVMERYQKIYEKRKEFVTEEMTGFVWVYLRK